MYLDVQSWHVKPVHLSMMQKRAAKVCYSGVFVACLLWYSPEPMHHKQVSLKYQRLQQRWELLTQLLDGSSYCICLLQQAHWAPEVCLDKLCK